MYKLLASNYDCMLSQQGYIFHVIWLNVSNKWNMEVPRYNPLLQTKVIVFSSCIVSFFCPNTIFWPKNKVLCSYTKNCIHRYWTTRLLNRLISMIFITWLWLMSVTVDWLQAKRVASPPSRCLFFLHCVTSPKFQHYPPTQE